MHVCNHFSLCSQTWHRVKRSADFIFSIYISKQRKVVSIVTIFQSNRFKELTENRISLKNFAKNRNWYWGQNVSHAKFVYRDTQMCLRWINLQTWRSTCQSEFKGNCQEAISTSLPIFSWFHSRISIGWTISRKYAKKKWMWTHFCSSCCKKNCFKLDSVDNAALYKWI